MFINNIIVWEVSLASVILAIDEHLMFIPNCKKNAHSHSTMQQSETRHSVHIWEQNSFKSSQTDLKTLI